MRDRREASSWVAGKALGCSHTLLHALERSRISCIVSIKTVPRECWSLSVRPSVPPSHLHMNGSQEEHQAAKAVEIKPRPQQRQRVKRAVHQVQSRVSLRGGSG